MARISIIGCPPMPFDPHSHQAVVFKNNTAVLVWIFMTAWMAMLASFTSLAVASGVPAFMIAGLGLFWLVGLGFTVLALWAPRVRVEILPHGVFVRERALLWKRERQFAAKDVKVSGIVETEDSEGGGVHYSCSLVLPDKEEIILGRGQSRSKVEQVRVQLISALMTAKRRAR
jgi:hypothetical protein